MIAAQKYLGQACNMHLTSAIPSAEKQPLAALHKELGPKILCAGWSTAAASFLLIGALIVITCACLCLMLPGINVIQHVILRGVVPALCAIVLSIPFIILAVCRNGEIKRLREEQTRSMVAIMENHDVPRRNKKQRVHFMLHNFLDWPYDANNPRRLHKNTDWSLDYQKKALGDLKEKLGKNKKNRNKRQEKIATAIDQAVIDLQNKKNYIT
jgi:hypothetical protein